jgi:hypothetical protein
VIDRDTGTPGQELVGEPVNVAFGLAGAGLSEQRGDFPERDAAVVTTVAVSRSQHYLAANKGANPLAALTAGYQSAFLACAVLAGIGLALALLLPGRPRNAAHQPPEPVPAASARH